MSKVFSLFVLLFLLGSAYPNELLEVDSFGSNPGNLKMFMYIPDAKKNKELSLVVALHGCSQDAKSMASQSGWNRLADKYEFIVLYPQQKITNNGSLCFNWFLDRDSNPIGGESESIFQMIQFLKENYPINEEVFTYGLSAGAAMSTILLANYPTLFKSGAVLAGGPYKAATNYFQGVKVMVSPKNLSPEEWGDKVNVKDGVEFPKLILLHGKKDKIVDIQNSYELIDQWSDINDIDTIPDNHEYSFNGNRSVDRLSYLNAKNEEVIVFYKIRDFGHSLPVDPDGDVNSGGEIGMFAKDIDFFSTYFIGIDFGIIKR